MALAQVNEQLTGQKKAAQERGLKVLTGRRQTEWTGATRRIQMTGLHWWKYNRIPYWLV